MKKDLRELRDYTYYDLTRSMCRQCRNIVDALIIFRDDKVYLRSLCPEHGAKETLIAGSVDWYLQTINSRQIADQPKKVSRAINKGCPFDCGLCSWHEKSCNLPVFSITNACNLKCPICFTYNRADQKYFMTPAEYKKILDWIIEAKGSVDLINITGGEPTLHPELFKLIGLSQRKEIGRITLNSNGLTLAADEDLVKRLAEHNVYVILSFNTYNRAVSKKIHGRDITRQKMKALENLRKYNVQTTLLNVSIKNLNDSELGRIIELALNEDFIRSITIQNMTYTGWGGKQFMPREHLTIDEVMANIVNSHGRILEMNDFSPLPGSHPLCYSVCYLFHDGNYNYPLKRLFSAEEYLLLLSKGYLLHPDDDFQRIMQDKISALWAQKDKNPEAGNILKMLKKFIARLYPENKKLTVYERQKLAESFIKTIYIHSHMDEDNLDLSRLVRCGDLVPAADQTLIPACSYNLFYRMKDKRFWQATDDHRNYTNVSGGEPNCLK